LPSRQSIFAILLRYETALAPQGERRLCGRKSKAVCPNPKDTLD